MRVSEALAFARESLAPGEATRAVAAALERETAWLIAHGDDLLDDKRARRLREVVDRRAAGEPLAYIVGIAGFYGRQFRVTSDVLVPRPETEHLVDDVIADVRDATAAHILDVGTGSGALAVTLACELPRAQVTATDISAEALYVARDNAKRHAATVAFVQTSLVEGLRGRYRVVVANLPYVPSAEIPVAPDPVSFEPRLALDGGADGLDLYRELLVAVPSVLEPDALVVLEAAPPTMEGLLDLARTAFPRAEVTVRKDYAGLERYVRVKLPG